MHGSNDPTSLDSAEVGYFREPLFNEVPLAVGSSVHIPTCLADDGVVHKGRQLALNVMRKRSNDRSPEREANAKERGGGAKPRKLGAKGKPNELPTKARGERPKAPKWGKAPKMGD